MTQFGLAIRNFVGPGELPDVQALYAYSERAEALGFESLLAGVTVEQVRDQTPFDLVLPERVGTTPRPRDDELAVLRALDPERQFLGAPERTS